MIAAKIGVGLHVFLDIQNTHSTYPTNSYILLEIFIYLNDKQRDSNCHYYKYISFTGNKNCSIQFNVELINEELPRNQIHKIS